MTFDFTKLNVSLAQNKPTHPIEIFRESFVLDADINDLWLGQGDALRDWHNHRNEQDIAVVLNTGAGKTLVGLLIAQSLVHETQRQVLYACNTIQLVEQTAEKARGYGLPVTTYYRGQFSSDGLYQSAEAPCVTNYQALFNGRSRFGRDDVAAVVFDDAHTAEHILRSQFSLTITRSKMEELYHDVVTLFQPYHEQTGRASSYAELVAQTSSHTFFVPPFEVHNNIDEFRRLLVQANLGDETSTMFSWAHLQDHEDLCCLLISEREITLTPPYIPVATLPYFDSNVRRVYLSATLSTSDSFVRSFGRKPERIIKPTTTAGACERMILLPSTSDAVADDVEATKEVIVDQKTLILVPNFRRARKWTDIATPPTREDATDAVSSFRNAASSEKLILAARYDGIDLPGDTCRVLVLDELPRGAGPLENFLWERLNMQNSLRGMLATRIVQSLGRISRGMSDHGVVVLTGNGLAEWIRLPRNRSLLPTFLQKQLEIGQRVSQQASEIDELRSAALACLSREPGWIQAYTDHMRDVPLDTASDDLEMALRIALAEVDFGRSFWQRDFQRAANILNEIMQDAFEFSQYTAAWLLLWMGFAFEMAGDPLSASQSYRRSFSTNSNIPRETPTSSAPPESVPQQVLNVAEQLRVGSLPSVSIRLPRTIVRDLTPLSTRATVRQVEEALRSLGEYLGLDSTRPDNEFGSGPDVLWISENGSALCMEVKTCKQATSLYRKKDVGQLHNHIQWVSDRHAVLQTIPVFVGPLLPASGDSSPTEEMKVVELQQFARLGQRLVSTLGDAETQAIPTTLIEVVNRLMRNRDLQYSSVVQSLDMSVLREIART